MFELARSHQDGHMSIKSISEQQSISRSYLEQLFVKLKRRGLVRSRRGPAGGFALAAAPKDLTLWDIICAVDEPLAPVFCVEEDGKDCPNAARCPSRPIWLKLRNEIKNVLQGTTLQDLCDCGAPGQRSPGEQLIYNI